MSPAAWAIHGLAAAARSRAAVRSVAAACGSRTRSRAAVRRSWCASAPARRARWWCSRATLPRACRHRGCQRGPVARRRGRGRRAAGVRGDLRGVRRADAQPRRARRDRLRQGLLHRTGGHRPRPLPRPREAPPAALRDGSPGAAGARRGRRAAGRAQREGRGRDPACGRPLRIPGRRRRSPRTRRTWPPRPPRAARTPQPSSRRSRCRCPTHCRARQAKGRRTARPEPR